MIFDESIRGMGYAPDYEEPVPEICKCVECLDEYPPDELHETSIGLMCDLHFECYKQECIELLEE